MKEPLSTLNAMERRSIFAVTTVSKSFCPCQLVLRQRESQEVAVDNANPSKDVYACPMHTEVKSDKPGKCPKCGMNLELKK